MEESPFGAREEISRRGLLKRGALQAQESLLSRLGVGPPASAAERRGCRRRGGAERCDGPLGLAARHARGDGRLQPLVPIEHGLLQVARDQRQADPRRRQRRAARAVRRAEPGRHGLRLAGRPHRVDRRRRPRDLGLGHDLRARSSTSSLPGGQQDHAPAAAEGKDDRPRHVGLEGDRRPDAGGGRGRSEDRQVPSSSGRSGTRRSRLSRPTPGSRGKACGHSWRRLGAEAQVPDRLEWARSSVEQLLGSERRSRGRPAKLDAYTRFLAGRRDGLRVRPREPARRGPNHVRAAPRSLQAITPQVALDSMLELATAYGTVICRRHATATTTGRCLGQLPQDHRRARPDQEAAPGRRRLHERPGPAGQREGQQGPGAGRMPKASSSTRPSRKTTVPKGLHDVGPPRGRLLRRRPGHEREAPMRTRLPGTRTRTTRTATTRRSRDRRGGLPHVELSAVPGWTEHVDLGRHRPRSGGSSRATASTRREPLADTPT